MMQFKSKDFFQVLVSLVLLPIIILLINEIKFLEIKDGLEAISEEKIIVVYDDFESNHGDIVCKILTDNLNSNDYKLLRFDYKKVNIEVIEKVLDYLSDNDKIIYFNNSNYPNNEVSSALKVLFYKRISQYKNLHTFQSGGNNENIVGYIKHFTGEEIAEKINQVIYNKLDYKLKEIKELAENKNVEQLISMFGRTYGVSFANIYRCIIQTREGRMKDIISEIVKDTVKYDDLSVGDNRINKQAFMKDIVQLYVDNLK